MKKTIVTLTLILSTLFFSLTTGVYGATGPKDIDVTLSDSPDFMKVGDSIELTATAVKHGSSFTDIWDNAAAVSTLFDPETETYISKANFTAVKPGTHIIRYTIQMTSGNSNTIFTKTVERTIVVINPVTVSGASIQDLTVSPAYKADGSLSGYSASGMIYALMSDNTASQYGSIFFFFGPEEKSKEIRVILKINNQEYSYLVTVVR